MAVAVGGVVVVGVVGADVVDVVAPGTVGSLVGSAQPVRVSTAEAANAVSAAAGRCSEELRRARCVLVIVAPRCGAAPSP